MLRPSFIASLPMNCTSTRTPGYLSRIVCSNGKHGRHGRHRADAQMTGQIVLHHGDFFAHCVTIGQHARATNGDAFAFGRQAVKALAAAAEKNRHAEFEFELFDSAGQARLALHCNVARRGRNDVLRRRQPDSETA